MFDLHVGDYFHATSGKIKYYKNVINLRRAKMHENAYSLCVLFTSNSPHIKRYPSIDREAPLIDARAPLTHGWAHTTNTQRRAGGLQAMWRHLSAMWRFQVG